MKLLKKSTILLMFLVIAIVLTGAAYPHDYLPDISAKRYNTPSVGTNSDLKRTVIIGDDVDYPPYSFLDENGQPAGFNIELAKALAEALDYNVEIRLGNWNDIKRQLETGEIDAIAGMFFSKEREKTYSFTTKHTVAVGDVFTKRGNSITDIKQLSGKTVAVQSGDIVHEYLLSLKQDISFIAVPTVSEALRLVESGQCHYAAVLRVPGEYIIDKQKLKGIKSNGLQLIPNDYCIAVRKDNYDLLIDLNGGLQILKTNGKYNEIYDKWLGVYENKTFWEYMRSYIWLVAAIFGIIAVLAAWTITLRHTVTLKTKELLVSNQMLQESQEELVATNEELEAYVQQLTATEEELRSHYDKLAISERRLEEEKELLKTTLLSVGDGVITTDSDGNITMLNHVAEKLTEWTSEEAREKSFEEVFKVINENTGSLCANPVKKALIQKRAVTLEENAKLITKCGKEILVADSVAPIIDRYGNVNGTVLVFRDVTEEKLSQRRIEYLSYHDQLTGLYNRRFFEEELTRLDVERNLPMTIIMADVNGLKLINDSFGHSMGDQLLKKVASVIEQGCRADEIISRIGGDEFVILLPRVDALEAEKIVNRINSISAQESVASVELSISFGWDTKYKVEEDIRDILKKAEDYMYKKKLFEGPSMRGKTIGAIINTLHEKNKREEQHSHRVSDYCNKMGRAISLSEVEVQVLKSVGLLHDIGKIAIDENILNKPGKLDRCEWEEIMKHPEIGYRILSSVNDMAEMAEYVLAHHEKWDGSGYPRGMKGGSIPIQSRIIAIADAYDAMTSSRSYRDAMTEEFAISELIKNAGTQFDPDLVKVFVEKVLN